MSSPIKKRKAVTGQRVTEMLYFRSGREGRPFGGGRYLNRDLYEVREQSRYIWGVPAEGTAGADALKREQAWLTSL